MARRTADLRLGPRHARTPVDPPTRFEALGATQPLARGRPVVPTAGGTAARTGVAVARQDHVLARRRVGPGRRHVAGVAARESRPAAVSSRGVTGAEPAESSDARATRLVEVQPGQGPAGLQHTRGTTTRRVTTKRRRTTRSRWTRRRRSARALPTGRRQSGGRRLVFFRTFPLRSTARLGQPFLRPQARPPRGGLALRERRLADAARVRQRPLRRAADRDTALNGASLDSSAPERVRCDRLNLTVHVV